MILLNPKKTSFDQLDPRSREIMEKTIQFFENKGKGKLKKDDQDRVWYRDFLDFVKENRIFATLLTPTEYGADKTYRWDTYRNTFFNEILGFYGLYYWYTWQVSILGLGPIWMSKNEYIKKRTAKLIEDGGIFGFGLSEKEHGADIRSNSMTLTKNADGTYTANGRKYYIGNGNEGAIISTQGKMADSGEFVFFAVTTEHGSYECVKNIVNTQAFVAEYALHDYPITEKEILHVGRDAWDAALNTVNVGKWNLGWASIGICTHAFYEAIAHAANRYIFGRHVTDFPHIKQLFTEAYARLAAMKLFATRATDYMRVASADDKRYLLYDPMVKMHVTMQGEEVINLIWDVIAAKGFEKDTFFEMAARDIRALPKLEGTVHVNMVLVVRFINNFLFNPKEYASVPRKTEEVHDEYLFNQGSTQKGLNQLQFHDYRIAYNTLKSPNAKVFMEQVDLLKEFMISAKPSREQNSDMDFMLTLGQMFVLVPFGQLISEMAQFNKEVDDALLDQIFDFFVRDFSKFAVVLLTKSSTTDEQAALCRKMIKKPVSDQARFDQVWLNHVLPLKDAYQMND